MNIWFVLSAKLFSVSHGRLPVDTDSVKVVSIHFFGELTIMYKDQGYCLSLMFGFFFQINEKILLQKIIIIWLNKITLRRHMAIWLWWMIAASISQKVRLIVYTNITQLQNGNRGGFETEIQLRVSSLVVYRVALLSIEWQFFVKHKT